MQSNSEKQGVKKYLSLIFRGIYAVEYSTVYHCSSEGLDWFSRLASPGPNASEPKVPVGDLDPNDVTLLQVGPESLPDGSLNPYSWLVTLNRGHVAIAGEMDDDCRALEEEERKIIERITAQLQVKSSADTPSQDGSTEAEEISNVSRVAYTEIIDKMKDAIEMLVILGAGAENLNLMRPFPVKMGGFPGFEKMIADKLTKALVIIYNLITFAESETSELEDLWDRYFPEFETGIKFNDSVKMKAFFQKCSRHIKDTGSLATFKEDFKSLMDRKIDFWEKNINDIHGYLFPKEEDPELINKAFTIGGYNRSYILALMNFILHVKRRFDAFCLYYRESAGHFDFINASKDEIDYIMGLIGNRAEIIANAALKLALNQYTKTDDKLYESASGKKEYLFREFKAFNPDLMFGISFGEFHKSVLIYDGDFLDTKRDDDDDDSFRWTSADLSQKFIKRLRELLNYHQRELYMLGPRGAKKVVE